MDGHYPALTLIEVNGASQAITQCGGRESADRGCASELMLLSSSKKMKEECTTFFRDCVAATMKVGIQWCWRRQKQTKPSRDSLVYTGKLHSGMETRSLLVCILMYLPLIYSS